MRYIDHVLADVDGWPPALRSEFESLVERLEWQAFTEKEAAIRAWILTRREEVAHEPVVVNRHHLSPPAPQPTTLEGKWPPFAHYVGRPPMSAQKDDADPGWRWARALHNPYPKDLYPDGLERFRLDLRRDMHAAKARDAAPEGSEQRRRKIPRVDAIDLLIPRAALVCSCVDSPWTPTDPTPPDKPLPESYRCHAHLIVAAWRARRKVGGP